MQKINVMKGFNKWQTHKLLVRIKKEEGPKK